MTAEASGPAEASAGRRPLVAPLVWIDCEMTGLDLRVDALVEVACVVTDAELNALDAGVSVVIRPPQQAWEQMSPLVTKMHEDSGLLPLIGGGTTLQEAEELVLGYVRGHVPDAKKAPLAGSSVHVDRGYLARDLQRLEAHLHYRIVDVSSLKELVRRWYPKVYFNAPEKTGNHRALGDVMDSIAELRYYRRTVFAPVAEAVAAGAATVEGPA